MRQFYFRYRPGEIFERQCKRGSTIDGYCKTHHPLEIENRKRITLYKKDEKALEWLESRGMFSR